MIDRRTPADRRDDLATAGLLRAGRCGNGSHRSSFPERTGHLSRARCAMVSSSPAHPMTSDLSRCVRPAGSPLSRLYRGRSTLPAGSVLGRFNPSGALEAEGRFRATLPEPIVRSSPISARQIQQAGLGWSPSCKAAPIRFARGHIEGSRPTNCHTEQLWRGSRRSSFFQGEVVSTKGFELTVLSRHCNCGRAPLDTNSWRSSHVDSSNWGSNTQLAEFDAGIIEITP
jgi:hypothetical protein